MPFALILLISILAGAIGALTGMGGGVILIPALTSLGVDIKQSIAIGVLSIIAVSNAGAVTYVRGHLPNLKISSYLEVFAVLGSLAGAVLGVAAHRRFLFLLCGMILLACSTIFWEQQGRGWQPASRQDKLSRRLGWEGSYYDRAEKKTLSYRATNALAAGPLGFLAGLISGLLGIGGSTFMALINNLLMGLPPKVSSTTSNLVIGVMGLAGASVYLEAGLLDPDLVAPMVLGVPVGAYFGSRLLLRMTNKFVLVIFLWALAALGVQMIFRGIFIP